jgi:hypothetical protein
MWCAKYYIYKFTFLRVKEKAELWSMYVYFFNSTILYSNCLYYNLILWSKIHTNFCV